MTSDDRTPTHMSIDEMTPQQAADLYRWAIGDGCRTPPEDPDEMQRVGRALVLLVNHAGDALDWQPVDDDGVSPMEDPPANNTP